MKLLTVTAASLTLLASAAADANAQTASTEASQAISVTRVGTQPSAKGPVENFTGAVRVDSRFQGSAPARIGGGIVTFEPGARTAWHTHPLGQTLIVTAGAGLVQHWDGPIQEIKPGDVVWIPPASNIGMEPLRPPECLTSPSRRRLTVKRSTGWKR